MCFEPLLSSPQQAAHQKSPADEAQRRHPQLRVPALEQLPDERRQARREHIRRNQPTDEVLCPQPKPPRIPQPWRSTRPVRSRLRGVSHAVRSLANRSPAVTAPTAAQRSARSNATPSCTYATRNVTNPVTPPHSRAGLKKPWSPRSTCLDRLSSTGGDSPPEKKGYRRCDGSWKACSTDGTGRLERHPHGEAAGVLCSLGGFPPQSHRLREGPQAEVAHLVVIARSEAEGGDVCCRAGRSECRLSRRRHPGLVDAGARLRVAALTVQPPRARPRRACIRRGPRRRPSGSRPRPQAWRELAPGVDRPRPRAARGRESGRRHPAGGLAVTTRRRRATRSGRRRERAARAPFGPCRSCKSALDSRQTSCNESPHGSTFD